MATTDEEQMIFWQKESHAAIARIMLKLDAIGKNIIDEKYRYAQLSRLLSELENIDEHLDYYTK